MKTPKPSERVTNFVLTWSLFFALLAILSPINTMAAETVTTPECNCDNIWGESFVGDENIKSELETALAERIFCTSDEATCNSYCTLLRSDYEGMDAESLADFPKPPVVTCESFITGLTAEDCKTPEFRNHPDCSQFKRSTFTPIPIKAPELEIPIPFINFSKALSTPNENEMIAPWIGEYIAGLYRFLLSIVGVVAGVFLIIGGYAYLTAGGSAERAQSGKRRIVNAITGLVLAFGSYVILYSINPDLVGFRALKLQMVAPVPYLDGGDETRLIEANADLPESTTASKSGGKPKAYCRSLNACEAYCGENAKPLPDPRSLGMADKNDTVKIGNHLGVIGGGHTTLPGTKALLLEAGKRADTEGYFILVTSAFRPIEKQKKLICNAIPGDRKRLAEGKRKKSGRTIAWPGGSFHGVGYALDLQLWKKGSLVVKNGKKVVPGRCGDHFGKCVSISGTSSGQNDSKWKEGSRQLAEIMFASGFRRLSNEIWHFEPKNAPKSSNRCASMTECKFPPNVP